MENPSSSGAVPDSLLKRIAQSAHGPKRVKREKYTLTACNQCKSSKIKCVRLDDHADCQRCSTMHIACIVMPTASQSAREKERELKKGFTQGSSYSQLLDEVSSLRCQLTTLTEKVAFLDERQDIQLGSAADTPTPNAAANPTRNCAIHPRDSTQQPRFAGPTRAAFSFNIVETSVKRNGVNIEQPLAGNGSLPSSQGTTPEPTTTVVQSLLQSGAQGLQSLPIDEIIRLLIIYEEEVTCVYPIINIQELIGNAPRILRTMKQPQPVARSKELNRKEVHMLGLAIATAITHEVPGKNNMSDRLVLEVEQDVGRISSRTEIELKDIQIMGMLSVYFCHTSEELFAWRAIGHACRQALEMGLHRKQSLLDIFKDPEEQKLAVQVFWVVYALDRRWSFGTSLSFALNDRDIDPQLPEPGDVYPFLASLVAHARLCSQVWEALPPYGSTVQTIPKAKEEFLEFITIDWVKSLPKELHFRFPRPDSATESQPRMIHRLRTLFYLRGNHLRTLIHRHHVLTPRNIEANLQCSSMVVGIAKDSIQALVHLNTTSDIYARQQCIYHYYLLSALAVLLLAVCNAPSRFAEVGRESFVAAVALVKGFSSHSTASRRLWKSIRGILPIGTSLGLHNEGGAERNYSKGEGLYEPSTSSGKNELLQLDPTPHEMDPGWNGDNHSFGIYADPIPNMLDIGDGLINLYNTFGSPGSIPSLDVTLLGNSFSEPIFNEWDTSGILYYF